MSFLKRLGYFLVGLSVGLLFLAYFLRKKSDETGVEFCYLPNCRVLKALREQPLVLDPQVQGVADTTAVAYLLREGDVDFDSSEARAEPCPTYFISGSYEGENLNVVLQRCDSLTRLTRYDRVIAD